MAGLARWCFGHRRVVLAAWLVVLVVVGGAGGAIGSRYSNNFTLPKSDSTTALNILKSSFPARSGDTEQIVVQARRGTLRNPAVEARVQAMFAKVATLPYVVAVTPPYDNAQLISPDGRVGLGTVNLNQQSQRVPKSDATGLIRTAQSFATPILNVQLGGPAVTNSESSSSQSTSDLLGVIFALIVLFFAFRRSILCATLPLISALVAIGIGTSVIGLLTHVISVPVFGPILAVLVALGVGIDYALFIVTRHRNALLQGTGIEESAVLALDTSGRAVFFAGITVCIALLGMFALQLSFLYGVALSAALVVALTMAASLTLLPAMLGFFGPKVLTRTERRRLAEEGPGPDAGTIGFWARWSTFIQGRSALLSLGALAIIAALALPFFHIQLGLADAGNDPPGSTSRQAFDLLAKGFGPGFNGPFDLVAETHLPGDLAHFDRLLVELRSVPGVAAVGPVRTNPAATVAIANLYPTTSPQDARTVNLLHRLRHSAIPRAEAGSHLVVHVGGLTAGQTDFSHALSSKLPQFVGVVVLLAFLLLAAVFRSLVIPLTASIMNLLSIGAALGVMTATFQFGWGQPFLGFAQAAPIEVFIPVMMFAILFGLSMDYEVFLVSRMHEEWVR
ncbi:MAG: MMPL family transporter, partial [Acidimicrobiales bacterium]